MDDGTRGFPRGKIYLRLGDGIAEHLVDVDLRVRWIVADDEMLRMAFYEDPDGGPWLRYMAAPCLDEERSVTSTHEDIGVADEAHAAYEIWKADPVNMPPELEWHVNPRG